MNLQRELLEKEYLIWGKLQDDDLVTSQHSFAKGTYLWLAYFTKGKAIRN